MALDQESPNKALVGSKNSRSFLNELRQFHKYRGTPFSRLPQLAGHDVDLCQLYRRVTGLGGWIKVTNENKWDELLKEFRIPIGCTNGGTALKHIYIRYLDLYEKIHFLDADPVRSEKNAEDETPTRKKPTSSLIHGVPLTYNTQQHNVSSVTRLTAGMCLDMRDRNAYQNLIMSLTSGLPNEVDFAMNVCMLLSNEGKHSLKLRRSHNLLNLLLAHVGIFRDGAASLRDLHCDGWMQYTKRNFGSFWFDSVSDATVQTLIRSDGTIINTEMGPGHGILNLSRDIGVSDMESQRVIQLAVILRNLSFDDDNGRFMANNSLVFRFLLLCTYNRNNSMKQLALDALGNLSIHIKLSALNEEHTTLLLNTLWKCLSSPDKFEVVRGLEILGKLCQTEANEDALLDAMQHESYQDIVKLLTVMDIQLIVFTLEALYQLSELGDVSTTHIAGVRHAVEMLVNLVTIEAQSYGKQSLVGIKVVEYITPVQVKIPGDTPTPVVTQNDSPAAPVPPPEPTVSSQPGTPIRPCTPPVKPSTPTPQTQTPLSSNDAFISSWLKRGYEVRPGSEICQLPMYAEYLTFCNLNSVKSVVGSVVFSKIIQLAFPSVELKPVTRPDGKKEVLVVGVRKKPPPPTPAGATPVRQTPGPKILIVETPKTAKISPSPIVTTSNQPPPRCVTPPLVTEPNPPKQNVSSTVSQLERQFDNNTQGKDIDGSANLIKSLLARKLYRNTGGTRPIQPKPPPGPPVKIAPPPVIPPLPKLPIPAKPPMVDKNGVLVNQSVNQPVNQSVYTNNMNNSGNRINFGVMNYNGSPQIVPQQNQMGQIISTQTQIVNPPTQIMNQPIQIVNPQTQIMNQSTQMMSQTQIVNQPTQIINQQNQIVNQQNQIVNQQNQIVNQQNQIVNQHNQMMTQQRQIVNRPNQIMTQQTQIINQPTSIMNSQNQMVMPQNQIIQQNQIPAAQNSRHFALRTIAPHPSQVPPAVPFQTIMTNPYSKILIPKNPSTMNSPVENSAKKPSKRKRSKSPKKASSKSTPQSPLPNLPQLSGVSSSSALNICGDAEHNLIDANKICGEIPIERMENKGIKSQPIAQKQSKKPAKPSRAQITRNRLKKHRDGKLSGIQDQLPSAVELMQNILHEEISSNSSLNTITSPEKPSIVVNLDMNLIERMPAQSPTGSIDEVVHDVVSSLVSESVMLTTGKPDKPCFDYVVSKQCNGIKQSPCANLNHDVTVNSCDNTSHINHKHLDTQSGINYQQESHTIDRSKSPVNKSHPMNESHIHTESQIDKSRVHTESPSVKSPDNTQAPLLNGDLSDDHDDFPPSPINDRGNDYTENKLLNGICGEHDDKLTHKRDKLIEALKKSAKMNGILSHITDGNHVNNKPTDYTGDLKDSYIVTALNADLMNRSSNNTNNQSYINGICENGAPESLPSIHSEDSVDDILSPQSTSVKSEPDALSDGKTSEISIKSELGITNEEQLRLSSVITAQPKIEPSDFTDSEMETSLTSPVTKIEPCDITTKCRTSLTTSSLPTSSLNTTPSISIQQSLPSQQTLPITSLPITSSLSSTLPITASLTITPSIPIISPSISPSQIIASNSTSFPITSVTSLPSISPSYTSPITISVPSSHEIGTSANLSPPFSPDKTSRDSCTNSDIVSPKILSPTISNPDTTVKVAPAPKKRIRSKPKPRLGTDGKPMKPSRSRKRPSRETAEPPPPPVEPVATLMCEWDGCTRVFASAKSMTCHIFAKHLFTYTGTTCLWPYCDTLERAKWSLVTHVQDNHCTPQALKKAAEARAKEPVPDAPEPTRAPHPLVYPDNAATQAIRRFAARQPYPQLMEPREGPVTKHIRLTSALILRNLARYSATGRTLIKHYEQRLSYAALSTVESSDALANCLWAALHDH